MIQRIVCERCGESAPKRGPGKQKYCLPCSEICSRERAAKWAREVGTPRAASAVAARGLEISRAHALSLPRSHGATPPLIWTLTVAIPYNQRGSKNAIYTPGQKSHIALRREAVAYRDGITLLLKSSIASHGQRIAHNKVWIDLFIQKPNHTSDAINLIDLLCDAIKKAVGVDDRWFSIARVDWQIVKENPNIFIQIGQESECDVSVCSSCGRVLPLNSFQKNASLALGIARNCRDCAKSRVKRLRRISVPLLSEIAK